MSNNVAEHVRSVYTAVSDAARGSTPQDLYARSWVRCVNDYGLDPAKPIEPRKVTPEDLQVRTERLGELVSCAKLEMANLYQQLADSQSAVVLTDSEGVIVCLVGDPAFTRAAARHGLLEGAIWSEEEQGTNGMGTCLKERSPIVIHRAQHFLARNTSLTCTAAPIFDSRGNLAAVLDLSSQSRLAQQHSTVLVSMAAQMIENRTFLAEHKQDYIIRFHSRPEFVYTLHEGELAMSAEGKVIAANRSALFQLGHGSHEDIVGADIGGLFNTSLPDLISRCVKSSFHPVPLYGARQGSRFFAVAQQPARAVQPFRDAVERHAAQRTVGSAAQRDSKLHELEFGDDRMAGNVRCAMRVINKNIPILLVGETGSGKEVFSKAMHYASARSGGPFVAVNCASIPDTLIESELFGYKSGAFTGASREGRRGKIIQANGGTLFLDEIGDMPLHLQARLLRVLEEREVVPLGSESPIPVDIQLISATHRNLQDMVARGEFREDLYYRLQGISITLPPLRVRKDKAQLIERALGDESEPGRAVKIDAAAMRVLDNYSWPGNMRQLRNVLRTSLALCEGDIITVRDLPPELLQGVEESPVPVAAAGMPVNDSGLNSLESAEREALLQELERHRWNITSLAQELDTSRNTIYRKMKRLNITTASRDRNAA